MELIYFIPKVGNIFDLNINIPFRMAFWAAFSIKLNND